MKYRIIEEMGITIITEDGGITSTYYNEESWITDYYQMRLTEITDPSNVYLWDELSNSKMYSKEWEQQPSVEEVVKDSLEWLVIPSPDTWTHDKNLFSNIFGN